MRPLAGGLSMTEPLPTRSLVPPVLTPASSEMPSRHVMADPAADFDHDPVMLDEIVELLSPSRRCCRRPAPRWSRPRRRLLSAASTSRFMGSTRTPIAGRRRQEARIHSGSRGHPRDRFDRCRTVLRDAGVESISGFLMDLGVSSPQLDVAERGFSYRTTAPSTCAWTPRLDDGGDVVNDYPVGELHRRAARYGDERHAQRIARAIVASRPLSTTTELAE